MSKFWLGVVISIQSLVGTMLYHFPTPFFIEKAEVKGIGVNLSGLILASASLGPLILGFYTRVLVSRCGHKKLMISAILAESLLATAFGLCDLITKRDTFFATCLVMRIGMGMPIFIHKYIGYMLAAKYLPEKFEFIALCLSMGNSGGVALSLSQSMLIYQAFGQSMLAPTLLLIAIDMLIYLPIAIWCVPSGQQQLSQSLSEALEPMLSTASTQEFVSIKQLEPPSFKLKHALKLPRVWILIALTFLQSYSDSYYASTFISEIQTYGLSANLASQFLGLRPLCSVLAMLLLPFIRAKFTRASLLLCFVSTQIVALFFLGPSTLLGDHACVEFIFIGLLLKGLSAGVVYSMTLPEINYAIKERYGSLYSDQEICNVTSGLNGTQMEFGTMLAYFTGAIVCNSLSFRGAADAINLLYVCIFMAIALSSSKRPNNLQYKSVLPLKTRA